MSDLEQDIQESRVSNRAVVYNAEKIDSIQKKASSIVHKYEEDMAARFREEMISEYRDYLRS